MNKLAIIAGGGNIPLKLAYYLKIKEKDFLIIGIKEAEINKHLKKFNNYFELSYLEIEKILKLLRKQNATGVVLIGHLKRPSKEKIKQSKFGKEIIKNLKNKDKKGDDQLLKEIITLLEKNKIKVIGIQTILKEMLAEKTNYSKIKPTKEELQEIKSGIQIAKNIGKEDIGQSIIIEDGYVIAVEAAEGTDCLIKRSKNLKKVKGKSAILIKVKKPNQEMRIDLPTIGPNTIKNAAKAKLKGIAVEAENVLIVNKEKTKQLADKYKIFLTGI
jgi:hypothetical protein